MFVMHEFLLELKLAFEFKLARALLIFLRNLGELKFFALDE